MQRIILLALTSMYGVNAWAGSLTVTSGQTAVWMVDSTGRHTVVNGGVVEFASSAALVSTAGQDLLIQGQLGNALLLNGIDLNLYSRRSMSLIQDLNFTLGGPNRPDLSQDAFEIAPSASRELVVTDAANSTVAIIGENGEMKLKGLDCDPWTTIFTADATTTLQGFDDRLSNSEYFPWKSVQVGTVDGINILSGYTLQIATPGYFSLGPNAITGLVNGETAVHAFDSSGNLAGGMNVKILLPATIDVAYCNVVSTGSPAYTLSASDIQDRLNEIFAQCAIQFTVTARGSYQIPFDLNTDGCLALAAYKDPLLPYSPTNTEAQIVVDDPQLAAERQNYDVVLVVADCATIQDGAAYRRGQFVFASWAGSVVDTTWIIAHEMGHAIGDLPDLYNDHPYLPLDPANLMEQYGSDGLRVDQWARANGHARTR